MHSLQIFVYSHVLNWTPRPQGLESPQISRAGDVFQALEYFELRVICMESGRIVSCCFGVNWFMSVASILDFLSESVFVSNLTTLLDQSPVDVTSSENSFLTFSSFQTTTRPHYFTTNAKTSAVFMISPCNR